MPPTTKTARSKSFHDLKSRDGSQFERVDSNETVRNLSFEPLASSKLNPSSIPPLWIPSNRILSRQDNTSKRLNRFNRLDSPYITVPTPQSPSNPTVIENTDFKDSKAMRTGSESSFAILKGKLPSNFSDSDKFPENWLDMAFLSLPRIIEEEFDL